MMNFIEKAFEQQLCEDEFINAMSNIYRELKVRKTLDKYPLFVQGIIP